jgi:hypothetical protein
MDRQTVLQLLLIVAASSCVDVAVTGAPEGAGAGAWPVALAAYSVWALASLALAVLLPCRRPE